MKVEPIVVPLDERRAAVLVPVALKEGPTLFLIDRQTRIPSSIDVPDDQVDDYFYAQRRRRDDAVSVLLVANDRCNMGCDYCFERTVERSQLEMDDETARASIRHVVANAQRLGSAVCYVSFFGGEPTLSLPWMERQVAFAREEGARAGVTPEFGITTNGLFNERAREFICRHFNDVILSIDGPEALHNLHRRSLMGKPTFQQVFQNARFLFQALPPASVTFRVTLTDNFSDAVPAVVAFFEREFPGAYLHLEPVLKTDSSAASTEGYRVFGRAFLAALRSARGVHLQHSDLFFKFKRDLHEVDYCGASRGNFYVTPDGHVTACSRVIRPEDEPSDTFFVGRVADGGISFDGAAEERLNRVSVGHREDCASCYARFNCKGGCPWNRRMLSDATAADVFTQCEAVRELTRGYLETLLEKGDARIQSLDPRNG